MIEKVEVSPLWCDCYQKIEKDNACVEVEIPGVKKESIDLRITDQGFTLTAPKEDVKYVGAWTWCCPIDSGMVKARYNNGLLKIEAPLKSESPSKKVRIE